MIVFDHLTHNPLLGRESEARCKSSTSACTLHSSQYGARDRYSSTSGEVRIVDEEGEIGFGRGHVCKRKKCVAKLSNEYNHVGNG